MKVPWAAPQGRFTLLFERFAVEVLLACARSTEFMNMFMQVSR